MERSVQFAAACMLALSVAACSQSETPFVDMCQKIAGNLVAGSISNWDKVEKANNANNLQVELAWSGDADGTATCIFNADTKGEETYQASPATVVMNGEKVPFRQLLVAAAKSSGKIIGESAEQTAKDTKKLASDASEKAGELAGQAREVADTAKERATELAGQASEAASELAGKAREVAGEIGDKARATALDATKAVQDKLEQ